MHIYPSLIEAIGDFTEPLLVPFWNLDGSTWQAATTEDPDTSEVLIDELPVAPGEGTLTDALVCVSVANAGVIKYFQDLGEISCKLLSLDEVMCLAEEAGLAGVVVWHGRQFLFIARPARQVF